MFSNGCLTNDWSHHLANNVVNPEDAAFFRQFLSSASSWQGSLSTNVNLCSLKADNAAMLQLLASSDPTFIEHATKFSSLNGESLKSSTNSSRPESDGGGRLVAIPKEIFVIIVFDRHPTNGISRKRKIDQKRMQAVHLMEGHHISHGEPGMHRREDFDHLPKTINDMEGEIICCYASDFELYVDRFILNGCFVVESMLTAASVISELHDHYTNCSIGKKLFKQRLF